MRGLLKAGLALVLAAAAIPATGQIAGGFGVNHSDGEAFIEAIEKGDNNAAIPLIEQAGSRVANYKNYKGDTALHVAVRKRELDWVGYLLKKGADPNIGDANGDTALIIASRIGFEEAATWMVQLGAKVDAPNRRGETPLIIAVQQRQPRIVEILLKAGANPDKGDHAAGLSARDYAKRDTRNPQLLKLIETVKSTKKQAAGPSVN
ncbi:ankyrin repeat domain-containing protein [Sphingomonas sp.]|uniref:ankyrin repeat domain-containing protein n=1 Tax=Sphingomonas sp. TaxID=28214 RepID=UPI0025E2D532|nr:ankyrin repeat domain-containing protein [Sphingomonas sp.]